MIERPNLDKMEIWATSFDRTEMLVLIQYTRQLEAQLKETEEVGEANLDRYD